MADTAAKTTEAKTGAPQFSVSPLSVNFGARVEGLDLSVPMDADTIHRVRETLRAHKVLVFPPRAALQPEQLAAFAKQFGEPETADHPQHPGAPGAPAVKILAKSGPEGAANELRASWHTDGGQRENPHWLTILQAKVVPPLGRDTAFYDMEAAYNFLSPALQAFVDSLTAEHSWGYQKPEAAPVRHPLIMRDPVNGAKTLYVNPAYTRRICELSKDESDALLAFLYSRTRFLELQLRVSWTADMIVMWDNMKVQHYLVLDKMFDRLMHRVMVEA